MGIRLDTPAPTEIAQDAAITQFQVSVPHKRNEGGAIKIVKEGVTLSAKVQTYNETGELMDRTSLVINLADLPGPVKTVLKDLYEWLEGQAQANGLIGAGAAEPIDELQP